jgi:hypothetical protein
LSRPVSTNGGDSLFRDAIGFDRGAEAELSMNGKACSTNANRLQAT